MLCEMHRPVSDAKIRGLPGLGFDSIGGASSTECVTNHYYYQRRKSSRQKFVPFLRTSRSEFFSLLSFSKANCVQLRRSQVFKSKSYPLVISWAVKRKRETIFLHNFFKTRRSVYSTSKSNISISFFEKKKRSDYLLNERRNLLFLSHPLFRLFRRIERSCYGRINTPHTGGRERRRMRLMRGKEEEGKKECANIRGRARERRLACRSRGMLS